MAILVKSMSCISYLAALLIMLLSPMSCSSNEYYHGFSFKDIQDYQSKITAIKPGKTSEIEILQTLGSPSIVSAEGERVFVYAEIAGKVKPIIHESQESIKVLWIAFDANHVVSSLAFDEYAGAHDFQYHDGVTKTEAIESMSKLQQFLKSFGKVSVMKPQDLPTSATGK